MRLNLSSQIVLNKVPVEFYKPKTTVEYSEISRMEKIHTDIFASMAEGASHVADKIEAGIKAAQQEGKFYVMALGSGSSLYSVYDELVRRYNEKTLSFHQCCCIQCIRILSAPEGQFSPYHQPVEGAFPQSCGCG